MIVSEINNHVSQALGRLLSQYQGLPNLAGLVSALVQQVQDLENGIYPVDQYRQLQYAFGKQLDNLGTIIGLPRNGLTDQQYFVFLLGTIAENFSDTTSPSILNIVKTVFQASEVFIKTPNSEGTGHRNDYRPAAVSIAVGDPTTPASLYPVAEQIVLKSLGAGINLTDITSFVSEGCFATAGPQVWTRGGPPLTTPDAGHPWPFGCADLNNPYVGGPVPSLILINASQ